MYSGTPEERKAKQRAYRAEWRAANRERIREYDAQLAERPDQKAKAKARHAKNFQQKKADPEFRRRRAAAHRDWVAKNREHVREYRKAWSATNPPTDEQREKKNAGAARRYEVQKLDPAFKEYRAEAYKTWVAANPDRAEARNKRWREANPHKLAALQDTRRKVMANATPPWADDEFEELVAREAYALRDLRTELTGVEHVVDHVIPLQGKKVSGLHVGTNLQVIARGPNARKHNKFDPSDPDKWRWPLGSAYR